VHTKLLALIAALAVGGTTGAVAFTSTRGAGAGPAPAQSPVADPCADPTSTDPACVVVVPVPAPPQVGDDDTTGQESGGVAPAPRAPAAPGVKLRGDGSVDDCCGGPDDDRSGRRGGDDRGRDDDRDDDDGDHDDRDDDRDDDDR